MSLDTQRAPRLTPGARSPDARPNVRWLSPLCCMNDTEAFVVFEVFVFRQFYRGWRTVPASAAT